MGLTKVRGGGVDNPLTLGGGSASDNSIIFDGNAQDFHIGLDDSADSLTIGLGSTLGTTSHMVIDANGHVTKPLQPAFLVKPSTSLNNTAIGTTTIAFATEVYDVNGDFASNTFTAPVTGKYHFNLHMRLDQIDISSSYYQLRLVTSNRIYYAIFDPDLADGDFSYFMLVINVLADMDAGDTAYGDMQIVGGAAQMDMKQDSHFSGFLAC